MSKGSLCPECSDRKGGKEEIDVDGEIFTLPALCTGTERGLAWAVKIRKRILGALMKFRRPGENPVLWMRDHTGAKWWIQHRDDQLTSLLQDLRKAA